MEAGVMVVLVVVKWWLGICSGEVEADDEEARGDEEGRDSDEGGGARKLWEWREVERR